MNNPSCKIVLAKKDGKSEPEIYRINEFPTSFEDLKKKIQGKCGAKLPIKYTIKYEPGNGESKLIAGDHDFDELIKTVKNLRLLIEEAPKEESLVDDSIARMERELKGLKSYNDSVKENPSSEPVKENPSSEPDKGNPLSQLVTIPLVSSEILARPKRENNENLGQKLPEEVKAEEIKPEEVKHEPEITNPTVVQKDQAQQNEVEKKIDDQKQEVQEEPSKEHHEDLDKKPDQIVQAVKNEEPKVEEIKENEPEVKEEPKEVDHQIQDGHNKEEKPQEVQEPVNENPDTDGEIDELSLGSSVSSHNSLVDAGNPEEKKEDENVNPKDEIKEQIPIEKDEPEKDAPEKEAPEQELPNNDQKSHEEAVLEKPIEPYDEHVENKPVENEKPQGEEQGIEEEKKEEVVAPENTNVEEVKPEEDPLGKSLEKAEIIAEELGKDNIIPEEIKSEVDEVPIEEPFKKAPEDSDVKEDPIQEDKLIVDEKPEEFPVNELIIEEKPKPENIVSEEKIENKADIEIPGEPQKMMVSEKLIEELISKKLESALTALNTDFQQKLETQAASIKAEFTAKLSSMQEEINELKKLNKELAQKTQEIEQISKANKQVVSDQDHQQSHREENKNTDNDKNKCDGCGGKFGTYHYHCEDCYNLNYCQSCYDKKKHPHNFIFIEAQDQKPVSQPSLNATFPEEARKEPAIISAGLKYVHKLVLLNSGKQAWPKNTVLECISGRDAGGTKYIGSVLSGDKKIVELELMAPEKTKGKVQSFWMLRYVDNITQQHEYFGPQLQHIIIVEEPKHGDHGDSGKFDKIALFNRTEIGNKYSKEVREKANALKEITEGELDKLLEFVQNNASLPIDALVDKFMGL